jgi:hypothetical protein
VALSLLGSLKVTLEVLLIFVAQVPQVPPGAYHIYPQAQYEVFFEELQECIGIHKPFDGVEWYLVPAPEFHLYWGGPFIGYFDLDRIYLVENMYITESLVKHELLHYLLSPIEPGQDVHPAPPFGTCGAEDYNT